MVFFALQVDGYIDHCFHSFTCSAVLSHILFVQTFADIPRCTFLRLRASFIYPGRQEIWLKKYTGPEIVTDNIGMDNELRATPDP